MSMWIPVVLAGLGASLYFGIRWFERRHLFKPRRKIEATPGQAGLEFEEVDFFAADGKRLHGWWIPATDARGTVLYCHGNAGNISTRIDVYTGLNQLGVNIFTFDYRGYGESRGSPDEDGLYADARAAFEVVRERYEDADAPPVVLYGASLGGSVAAQLATEQRVRGLIIEGGFTSAIDVGERWFPQLPVRSLARYRFDAAGKLMALPTPKLFAHSRGDEVIPWEIGQELFRVAAEPKQFVALQGRHGEAGWRESPAFYNELKVFLAKVF